ncbi:hypothetical protein D3C84_1218310 [compost metagenome]
MWKLLGWLRILYLPRISWAICWRAAASSCCTRTSWSAMPLLIRLLASCAINGDGIQTLLRTIDESRERVCGGAYR